MFSSWREKRKGGCKVARYAEIESLQTYLAQVSQVIAILKSELGRLIGNPVISERIGRRKVVKGLFVMRVKRGKKDKRERATCMRDLMESHANLEVKLSGGPRFAIPAGGADGALGITMIAVILVLCFVEDSVIYQLTVLL